MQNVQVYTDGRLLAVSKETFSDPEGVKVEYFVNAIKGSQGLMTLNSKRDFSGEEGEAGVIVLRLSEDPERKNRFKVSLAEFRVGETLGLPEAQIF